MPKPVLCLEEVSPANQISGDGMSKPVETDVLQTSVVPKFGEPVAESAGGQAPIMVQVPGEQPVTETPLAGGSSEVGSPVDPLLVRSPPESPPDQG
jgi:hypothetical protein